MIQLQRIGFRQFFDHPVQSLGYFPSGQALYTATQGEDDWLQDVAGVLHTWDFEQGTHRRKRSVNGYGWAALSPTGASLAWSFRRGIYILDPQSDAKRIWLHPRYDGGQLAYAPDGRILATATPEQTVTLWDTATWQEITRLATGGVMRMEFSPDGTRLALLVNRFSLDIWNVQSQHKLSSIIPHEQPSEYLQFSPDSTRLAVSGKNGIRIYDYPFTPPGWVLTHIPCQFYKPIVCAFVPHTQRLLTGDYRGRIKLWDVQTRQLLAQFRSRGSIEIIAASPNGAEFATGHYHGEIRLWRMRETRD